MFSHRILALCLTAFASTSTLLFAQAVLVTDTFAYDDAASFMANWPEIVGSGASFTPGNDSLTLSNTLAVRDVGAPQQIPAQQNWNLSSGIVQTAYNRSQWFGLFTANMCHGYLARWTSTSAANKGSGLYSIYRYDSTTPLSTWNPSAGKTLLVSKADSYLTLPTTPVNFTLSSAWDAATHERNFSLTVPSATGTATTLQAEVADTNQQAYTRIALSGNSSGIFSSLTLTSLGKAFNVVSYGAKGDGKTDDTAAINKAIAAAQSAGGSVYIPATAHSYIYSSCIFFNGISVYGDGVKSLLQAADPNNSAIVLEGNNPSLSNVKITSPLSSTVGRLLTPQSSGVTVYLATNFTVTNVSVATTASTGIICMGGSGTVAAHALITNCNVANTLADGIHLTQTSSYIDVRNNTVTNTGDDMFAVVSYTYNHGICHDIVIAGNSGAGQSANGRGISVIGGNNVKILNNNIQKTRGAGVYLASELIRDANGNLIYKTYGVDSIIVQDNVLNDLASTVYHGGINICGRLPDTTDPGQIEAGPVLVTNVTLTGNTITNAHHSGITLQGGFDHIYIESNKIDTTAEQGLNVFGGSNLFVGESGGNTFNNIGQYGIYDGLNSYVTTFTTGTIDIENNTFGNTNVLGTFAVPIISLEATSISGQISNNQFNVSGKYQISTPYVRYGVN